MDLIEKIIEASTSKSVPVADLLRRCLVLEDTIRNQMFREWLDSELDGYGKGTTVPEYRSLVAMSRGMFISIRGQINDQPLSLHVMKKEHREGLENLELRQPISSYETSLEGKEKDFQIPWPPALAVLYQEKFIPGWTLNRAWQELPGSSVVGLVDTVRTRTLRFALELRRNLGDVKNKVEQLNPAVVEKTVVNYIFNGNPVIGAIAHDSNVVASVAVQQSDMAQLMEVLKSLGFNAGEIKTLENAIEEDGRGSPSPTFGSKVTEWLKSIGKTVGSEALKGGVDIAKKAATKAIMQYFGLDIG